MSYVLTGVVFFTFPLSRVFVFRFGLVVFVCLCVCVCVCFRVMFCCVCFAWLLYL